jgi:hypothetical protein
MLVYNCKKKKKKEKGDGIRLVQVQGTNLWRVSMFKEA